MDMHDFDADVEYTFGRRGKTCNQSSDDRRSGAGCLHCPLNYARIGKPIYCLEMFMTTGYSGVDLGEDLKEIRVPERATTGTSSRT